MRDVPSVLWLGLIALVILMAWVWVVVHQTHTPSPTEQFIAHYMDSKGK